LSGLLDIFGFVAVVLQGLELVAQTLLIGSVAFILFAVPQDTRGVTSDARGIIADSRRVVRAAALATALVVAAATGLNVLVLGSSLGVGFGEVAGAGFVVAGAAGVLASGATGLLARLSLDDARTRFALGCGALLTLCASVATSHAVARLHDEGALVVATALHELGAALWLGGLLCFRLALGSTDSLSLAERIGRRYSLQSIAGVALIVGGACVFAALYLGSVDAVYGTAYGAMAATKTALLLLLLPIGFANFRAVRRFASDPERTRRVRRFVEVEMGIGVAVLMAAASITSLPPAVDLVADRLAWSEIAARMAPAPPRLVSPDHAMLALPALQARLDAEAEEARAAARPQAFVPGSGQTPPRNANDVAWSEYNHHWAGVLVIVMGLAALGARSGRAPWARHWPLLFLLLAAFLFLRADAEVWPLGEIGFVESLRDPEVAQHRVFELLIVLFALFEWGVSTESIVARPLMRVFPLLMALAGTLLLTHSHSLGNVKEELLVELSHLPIAVLGVAAGWARWLEVEAPEAEGRWAGWVWPACLVLIGLLLLGYREA
jgi:putative copper resistance protein D